MKGFSQFVFYFYTKKVSSDVSSCRHVGFRMAGTWQFSYPQSYHPIYLFSVNCCNNKFRNVYEFKISRLQVLYFEEMFASENADFWSFPCDFILQTNQLFNNETSGVLITGMTLILTNLKPNSGGKYFCQAANMIGKERSNPLTIELNSKF